MSTLCLPQITAPLLHPLAFHSPRGLRALKDPHSCRVTWGCDPGRLKEEASPQLSSTRLRGSSCPQRPPAWFTSLSSDVGAEAARLSRCPPARTLGREWDFTETFHSSLCAEAPEPSPSPGTEDAPRTGSWA